MNAEELCGDETWWQIYKDSFPANQRETPDVILKSLLGGVGMAFRARLQGMTSGLATTHLPCGVLFFLNATEESF
jgi:hypothetical protein